jgi:hypothetical protein
LLAALREQFLKACSVVGSDRNHPRQRWACF